MKLRNADGPALQKKKVICVSDMYIIHTIKKKHTRKQPMSRSSLVSTSDTLEQTEGQHRPQKYTNTYGGTRHAY